MIKSGKNSLAFSYKAGNTFLHKMNPAAKILLIPVLNILVFNLPFQAAVIFLIFQAALAFFLGFTLREQLRDLRPVLYYAVILYLTSFFAIFFAKVTAETAAETYVFNWERELKSSLSSCFANRETVKMLVKLFCVMQSASILFKTSTTLQIREGIGVIEGGIRKILPVSKKNSFTDTASLFICFIPMVYKNWELSKRAWFARGGKAGIKMMKAIFPVFFSVGIRQAYNAARAMQVRSGD